MFDVIVVGGSYAGLAAALQLGRARRRVLVLDAGKRRNRFAHASHGFLTRDGESPDAMALAARREVLAYSTIAIREASATEVRAEGDGFVVRAGDGEELGAKRLILATGVVDDLPKIEGLAERWGKSVFHCPYCHGYELQMGRLGVLATHPLAPHHALLVAEWGSETTLFVNESFEPDADQLRALDARGIRIERAPIAAVSGTAPNIDVQLRDGRSYALDGLFLGPQVKFANSFAEQLGLELATGPMGAFYKTDPMTKETSVQGVYACGDVATMAPSVTFAVADGARAGISAHQSLVFGRAPAAAPHR